MSATTVTIDQQQTDVGVKVGGAPGPAGPPGPPGPPGADSTNVTAGPNPPADPEIGDVWMDTSS